MITVIILGADFWSRLGEFALDFKEKVLQSAKVGLCVQLKENHNKEWDKLSSLWEEVQVGVPAGIEITVQASIGDKGMKENRWWLE